MDETVTPFGVRTVSVSKEGGFQLNGVSRKIQGVCLHHDLGPLGAAVNKAALIRQVRLMKDMGCDAIRTSHNMPSTMQMEVCDSMGMMVMAESFDMWIYPKCKNGYARFFNDWAEKDIENLDRYRLRWMNTTYEPGEVKVVAYDKDGRPAMEKTLRTAGAPAQLKLDADKTKLNADGDDLSYITVSLCDENGTLCPDAMNDIEVSVEGAGTFRAICNGDATSLEVFTEPRMKLFHGQLVITVQAAKTKGSMLVKVKTPEVKTTVKGKKGKKPTTITQPAIEKQLEIAVK